MAMRREAKKAATADGHGYILREVSRSDVRRAAAAMLSNSQGRLRITAGQRSAIVSGTARKTARSAKA